MALSEEQEGGLAVDQRIINLYEEYVHGGMDRRGFMERLAELAGGSAAALGALALLQNNYAAGQIVAPDDSRLTVTRAGYEAGGVRISGYLARPKGGGRLPAVIVIHENRGLNPHIEDVTRRMALQGFLAFAPDMLSPLGGTPADESKGPAMIGSLNREETVARLAEAVRFLASHEGSTGKVGVVGFCWGGGMVNRLAAAGTALKAGVAYYGSQLPAEDVPKITAPLLLHYASLDQRINAGIPAYEAALKANNKSYQIHMYEGAQHAFNNNTSAARYHREAAELAWNRTVAFLRKHLG